MRDFTTTSWGRPRGEVRQALVHALRDGPAYPAQVATRAAVDVQVARRTLDNMCKWGEAQRLDTVPVPGSNRPARLYGLVGHTAGADAPRNASGLDWSLVDCWSAWPADL